MKMKKLTYGPADVDVSWALVPAPLRFPLVLCRPCGPRPPRRSRRSHRSRSRPCRSRPRPLPVPLRFHSASSHSVVVRDAVVVLGGAVGVVSAAFVVRCRAPRIQYSTRDPPHEQLLVRLGVGGVWHVSHKHWIS
jgi:hypothetical protein